MKITSALIGIAALGGVAFSTGAASAMPVTAPVQTSSVVVPAGYVCNEWGHCWHRHSYGYRYGYYHPHYWGGWGWHHHYWHHSWYRWHRWHSWNTGN
jgi:hypothetical protein